MTIKVSLKKFPKRSLQWGREGENIYDYKINLKKHLNEVISKILYSNVISVIFSLVFPQKATWFKNNNSLVLVSR